jgi:hypothetical protein
VPVVNNGLRHRAKVLALPISLRYQSSEGGFFLVWILTDLFFIFFESLCYLFACNFITTMPWSIHTPAAKVDKWAPHLIMNPVTLTALSKCPILAVPGAGWRMSILRVLRPLKRRPVDDHAILVWPHCCLTTSAVLVRACRDLCPAVPTTLPEVAPARLAPLLAALPIVRVAWLTPARLATCGPHLMALGITCRGAAMSPCFRAALVALTAAQEAADLAAARASRAATRAAAARG